MIWTACSKFPWKSMKHTFLLSTQMILTSQTKFFRVDPHTGYGRLLYIHSASFSTYTHGWDLFPRLPCRTAEPCNWVLASSTWTEMTCLSLQLDTQKLLQFSILSSLNCWLHPDVPMEDPKVSGSGEVTHRRSLGPWMFAWRRVLPNKTTLDVSYITKVPCYTRKALGPTWYNSWPTLTRRLHSFLFPH